MHMHILWTREIDDTDGEVVNFSQTVKNEMQEEQLLMPHTHLISLHALDPYYHED